MNEKYNGWTNYETWLANFWFTEWHLTAADFLTDEEIAEAVQAQSGYDYYKISGRLYERLKDQVEEFHEMESNNTGLFSDLLNAAISRIDWADIANVWLSDLVEEVKRNA